MRRPAKIGPVLAPLAATTAAWALATAATLIAIPRYGLPAPVAAAIAFVLAIGWLLAAATVLRRRVGRPPEAPTAHRSERDLTSRQEFVRRLPARRREL